MFADMNYDLNMEPAGTVVFRLASVGTLVKVVVVSESDPSEVLEENRFDTKSLEGFFLKYLIIHPCQALLIFTLSSSFRASEYSFKFFINDSTLSLCLHSHRHISA